MNKFEIMFKFGKLVRERRKQLGLSQEKLAEETGCHRTYIGMVERGEKNLTLTNIVRISKALRLSPSKLMRSL
jgi:transcriptional regulator with XRE-family HTH domain